MPSHSIYGYGSTIFSTSALLGLAACHASLAVTIETIMYLKEGD